MTNGLHHSDICLAIWVQAERIRTLIHGPNVDQNEIGDKPAIEDDGMIYLVVRLAQNSATAGSKFSRPEEVDQFWLDPTPRGDEESQIQLLEEDLDHSRVQWYRSPKIAYVLRTP
jgi:hypothetical protein